MVLGQFDSAHRSKLKSTTMQYVFYKGLEYVKVDKSRISCDTFLWGDELIIPGHIFTSVGTKKRSSLNLNDASLKYAGRINENLLFSVVSSWYGLIDDWYITASYVDETTLLMQSTKNGFWDIKY